LFAGWDLGVYRELFEENKVFFWKIFCSSLGLKRVLCYCGIVVPLYESPVIILLPDGSVLLLN
jgi:hypothetical protein